MFKLETGEGLPDATSYVDIAYATDFINFHYPEDSEWGLKSASQKELALVMATKFVDRLVKWAGEVYKTTQSLQWPRTEFKDADGRTIEAGTLPLKVKDAVVMVALESFTNDIYEEGALVTSIKYGSSSETYAGPVRDGGNSIVQRLLKDFKEFGYGSSSSNLITIHRV